MPADPAHPRDFRVEEALRDGRRVTIRALRPDDRGCLREAYRRLSPEARYLRSFTYKDDLSDAELRRLSEPDFDREVALVVTVGDPETVIAGARYIQDASGDGAETAFTVLGEYCGLGIAGRLLSHLADIARSQRLKHFTAEVLAGNAAMLAVFSRSGLQLTQRREDGVVHLTMDLRSR